MGDEAGTAESTADPISRSFAVRVFSTPRRGTTTSGISRTREGRTKEMETCVDR
jgi:hypothetical protein